RRSSDLHVQGRPFEKAGFIQEQTDHNNCHEGGSGVPDNVPNYRNVLNLHNACQQGESGADGRTPAYAKPSWLPDDENKCKYEYCRGNKHREDRVLAVNKLFIGTGEEAGQTRIISANLPAAQWCPYHVGAAELIECLQQHLKVCGILSPLS